MIEIKSLSFEAAKVVAGELVAQFNQWCSISVDTNESIIVTMILDGSGDNDYKVVAYYSSGKEIPEEEIANAEDMAAEVMSDYDVGGLLPGRKPKEL